MIRNATPGPSAGRPTRAIAVVLLVVLGFVGAACESAPTAQHFKFVVPQGAMRLSSVGKRPEIFPVHLLVHVGDTITIVNNDDFDTFAGPYFVKAKSTITQTFASPGTLTGSCTLGAGDSFTLSVLERSAST